MLEQKRIPLMSSAMMDVAENKSLRPQGWECSAVVAHLPRMLETLRSVPNTAGNKHTHKNKKNRTPKNCETTTKRATSVYLKYQKKKKGVGAGKKQGKYLK